MKTFKLIAIGILLFISSIGNAQVSVNINIGSPPQWGPVGYPEVRYYYLPDVEAYYDVQSSMFIYYGGGVWLHRAYLPAIYSDYDLYGGYKVVMTDYRGEEPFIYYKEYKVKYKKGYRGGSQKTIGVKPGKGNSKSSTKASGSTKASQKPKSQSAKQPQQNKSSSDQSPKSSGGNGKQAQGQKGGGHGKRK